MPITIERVSRRHRFLQSRPACRRRSGRMGAANARTAADRPRHTNKGWLSSAWGITSSVADVINPMQLARSNKLRKARTRAVLWNFPRACFPDRPREASSVPLANIAPIYWSSARAANAMPTANLYLAALRRNSSRPQKRRCCSCARRAKIPSQASSPRWIFRRTHARCSNGPTSRPPKDICLSITSTTCRSRRGSRHMAYLRLPSMCIARRPAHSVKRISPLSSRLSAAPASRRPRSIAAIQPFCSANTLDR